MTLWANRMSSAPADALMAFTASLAFDKRLASSDVRGSGAHVHGLLRAGILTAAEADSLVDALVQVGAELASDSFEYLGTDEDIHTAIELRVTELAPSDDTDASIALFAARRAELFDAPRWRVALTGDRTE